MELDVQLLGAKPEALDAKLDSNLISEVGNFSRSSDFDGNLTWRLEHCNIIDV